MARMLFTQFSLVVATTLVVFSSQAWGQQAESKATDSKTKTITAKFQFSNVPSVVPTQKTAHLTDKQKPSCDKCQRTEGKPSTIEIKNGTKVKHYRVVELGVPYLSNLPLIGQSFKNVGIVSCKCKECGCCDACKTDKVCKCEDCKCCSMCKAKPAKKNATSTAKNVYYIKDDVQYSVVGSTGKSACCESKNGCCKEGSKCCEEKSQVAMTVTPSIKVQCEESGSCCKNGKCGAEAKAAATKCTTVQLPKLDFTRVNTTVSVPDGGTVILAGKRYRTDVKTTKTQDSCKAKASIAFKATPVTKPECCKNGTCQIQVRAAQPATANVIRYQPKQKSTGINIDPMLKQVIALKIENERLKARMEMMEERAEMAIELAKAQIQAEAMAAHVELAAEMTEAKAQAEMMEEYMELVMELAKAKAHAKTLEGRLHSADRFASRNSWIPAPGNKLPPMSAAPHGFQPTPNVPQPWRKVEPGYPASPNAPFHPAPSQPIFNTPAQPTLLPPAVNSIPGKPCLEPKAACPTTKAKVGQPIVSSPLVNPNPIAVAPVQTFGDKPIKVYPAGKAVTGKVAVPQSWSMPVVVPAKKLYTPSSPPPTAAAKVAAKPTVVTKPSMKHSIAIVRLEKQVERLQAELKKLKAQDVKNGQPQINPSRSKDKKATTESKLVPQASKAKANEVDGFSFHIGLTR